MGNKRWAEFSSNAGYFYLEILFYFIGIYFYVSHVPEKYISRKYHSLVGVRAASSLAP